MNNFTAFILGALLAVILVGYVFFSSDREDTKVAEPVVEGAADAAAVVATETPTEKTGTTDEKTDATKVADTNTNVDAKSETDKSGDIEDKGDKVETTDEVAKSDTDSTVDQGKVDGDK